MFGKKNKPRTVSYDPSVQTPVIRCSICNGEKVGGLKNAQTGQFEEIMLIRTQDDLALFEKMVGRRDIPREY